VTILAPSSIVSPSPNVFRRIPRVQQNTIITWVETVTVLSSSSPQPLHLHLDAFRRTSTPKLWILLFNYFIFTSTDSNSKPMDSSLQPLHLHLDIFRRTSTPKLWIPTVPVWMHNPGRLPTDFNSKTMNPISDGVDAQQSTTTSNITTPKRVFSRDTARFKRNTRLRSTSSDEYLD
jgi:hypothetical protein